jgi:peptide/nickel transport system permease protein
VYLLKRLAVLVVTLVVVSFLVFLIPYASPGDPARKILRSRVSDLAVDPASVAALRAKLGLGDPLIVQYGRWLGHAVIGDFGYSYTSHTPVSGQIGQGLAVSVTLSLSALLVALAIALPLGTLAATARGRPLDNVLTFVTQGLVALPEYWVAPLVVLVFALKLGWLPSAGWDGPQSMVLPAMVLALRPLSYFTQVTRASMIDALAAPHMTAARSRGLSAGRTLARHGMRNASLPVLTLFSVWLAGLLGGSVVVEVIFNVPGMGRLLYEAVVNSDIPMIQGGMVCIVALTVVITTLTDLAYTLVNPATRVSHAGA